MLKKLIILSALIMAGSVKAQDYELKADEKPGQIITEKGKVLKGYIKLNGDAQSPWKNQTKVEFFTEDALADGKVKGREREKYKPKDIKAYIVDDRYFESIKISHMKLSLGVGFESWTFVEKPVEGALNLYHLYETPDPVAVNVGEEEQIAYEQELERMRNNPLLVLQTEDEDPILLRKVDFAEYLANCPKVQEKYQSGGYGIEPWNPDSNLSWGNGLQRKRTPLPWKPYCRKY
ncbi:MAG: hypothetical protein U5L96_00460 [Owenweeksia sp.]|nr:hypothetical protein [Owenweeksia sp.]